MTGSPRRPGRRPHPRRAGPAARPAAPATALPPIGELPMVTGGRHPKLGVGLWSVGRWEPADEARTRSALERALELGLRWYDTAEVYGGGRSERLLGDALHTRASARPDLFIATKLSWEHLRAAQVRAAIIGSLRRLGLSKVDLYLVHAPDHRVPIGETMTALEALWKEGRIGAIGVSNFDLEQLEAAEAALSEARIAALQVRYNLLDREDGDPVRSHCAERGIVLEAYTPLLRGLLAGRYLDGERPPEEVQRFTQRVLGEETLEEVIGRARRLRDLASSERLPVASLALRWLERQGAAPLVGASRPEQVDALLESWSARPSKALLDEADRIALGERRA